MLMIIINFFISTIYYTDMRADCGSYFVTMYIYTEITKRLQKKRNEKERKIEA